MRAGRLDRSITIQRKTLTASASGDPQESWTTLGPARRAAQVMPVRGDERLAGPEVLAHEQTEFVVRYSSEIADLSPQDRIIYPALNDGDSPPGDALARSFYDVQEVHEIGRREGFRIIAIRRADTAS